MSSQAPMDPGRFQEMLQNLSSAYDQLHAEKETLRKELDTLRKPGGSSWAHSTANAFSPMDYEKPRTVRHAQQNPLEGRPLGEPVDVDEFGEQDDNPPTPPDSNGQTIDVKTLSSKDRVFYEQYQRIQDNSMYVTQMDGVVTAAMVVEVASVYYPLLELGSAAEAMRRFMVHACGTNGEDVEVASDGKGSDDESEISQTPSEQKAKEAAMSLCIPFDVFLRLAKLDKALLYESQSLQDDSRVLLQLHEALVKEKQEFLDEKKESISNIVETVSAVVICINAFTLVASIKNHEDGFWFGVEIGLCVFYTMEISFKALLRGVKWFFFGPLWQWNLYDLVVVTIGILDLLVDSVMRANGSSLEDSNMGTLRSIALLGRLARLLRLLRFKVFSELKSMVHGVLTGMRILFWAIVLLVLLIYCLGIFLWSTLGRKADQGIDDSYDNFRTLTWSMFTLFRCFTDGCSAPDGTPLHVSLAEELGVFFMVVYVFLFLFVTMGIFNLIMGMFIDNVFTANRRKSQMSRGSNAVEMQTRLKEALYDLTLTSPSDSSRRRNKFQEACEFVRSWFHSVIHSPGHSQTQARIRSSRIDAKVDKLDTGLKVSRQLFSMWLHDEHLLNLLSSLEINTSNKAELFDVLDSDQSGQLDLHEIVSGLMRMRGPPQKSDSVAALLGVRHLVAAFDDMRVAIEDMKAKLDKPYADTNGAPSRKPIISVSAT